ncbi:MAG: hypothetical protein JST70_13920 [Bacteroidetes bacterium]|nr:hypothetical protein [Bacteroidota bacterium]
MPVKIVGLVLVRQRPGTAGGICFMTVEDEIGFATLVVFEKLFEKYRKEILYSKLLMVEGKLHIEGEVIHVIVKRCYDITQFLRELTEVQTDVQPVQTLIWVDEKDGYPHHGQNKRSQVRTVVQ